ncbi:import inner membrane translocase subunit tim-21, mitochondrial [Hypoxylon trugodes]|uniref:import inner membrane translocase subunit tim-21, mitochondrial n=1 Tax=Hypoxylon trugodes TaxID=326681 RepID=UPI002194E7B4|nr:import inner membrane translocase subunit tim-21, mitochondrial [Hypoxylon trugodes]KAI1384878.1 import inner membrane translocase subunit tim-21, mitochondrial [Hypoxylon trugodes]
MKLLLRPFSATSTIPRIQPVPVLIRQGFATHHGLKSSSATSKRKAVTPFNDDGFVPWRELSLGEKTSRATQQTFNFGLVIVGLVLTGGISYFLYQDVFAPDSKTANFSRAFNRIKKDPECLALLGESSKITAHGEETANKWRRARPIQSTVNTDAQGNQHLILHFYVEGPLNNGTVFAHLTKRYKHDDFEWKYLCLDVKGHSRIYLENTDAKHSGEASKKVKLFGVSWN